MTHPIFAFDKSFAARVLWTITWSVHQYQVEIIVSPKINPGLGYSAYQKNSKKYFSKNIQNETPYLAKVNLQFLDPEKPYQNLLEFLRRLRPYPSEIRRRNRPELNNCILAIGSPNRIPIRKKFHEKTKRLELLRRLP